MLTMNYIMILPLLLMGTSCVLGHSIKKLEINNKTEGDVYEIKEDAAKNTVTFVNPKVDTPTLREIVYYHMIERPYGPNEGRVRYESEDGPEIDETMRPFTNSHGFPFLESVEKELDIESKNELKEDIPEEKEEVFIEYIPTEDDEVYEEIIYDELFPSISGSCGLVAYCNIPEEKEEVFIEYIPTEDDEVYEEIIYDEEFPVDIKIIKQEESKEIPITIASEILKEISTEAKIEETTETSTEKSKLEVDVLETSSNPETTSEAHLIEETTQAMTVTEIPIATSVTEEPVYEKKAKTARKLLFDRVKERYYSKPNETQNTSSTAERKKRDISMHIPEAPKLGELNYDSLPPYLRRLISTEKPKARINSDSESDEEERLDDIKHRMHKLMSTLKTADSLEEKPRTYGMNLTADSGYIWNDMTNPGFHYEVEASESIEEDIKEPENKVKPKSLHQDQDDNYERSNEDKSHEEKHKEDGKNNRNNHNDDHEETSDSTEDSLNNSFEDKSRKKNKHKENDDMNQLIENDQFWKWLADWTSVYMDVLADHIQEAVHQEVIDQIKTQAEEHNKDSKVPVEEIITKDHIKDDNLDQPEEKDTNKYDDEKITTEPVVDNVAEKNKSNSKNKGDKSDEEDLLRKRKENEDKKKKDETSVVKDEKNIKNDTKVENKPLETAKIEAQNVYGNTIGDKVTNIFIFYPNQDADKVIKDISKLNHSNNVQIDVRLNVSDEERKDETPKKDALFQTPIEKKEVLTDDTTEIPKESSQTPDTSKDIVENSKTKAILEIPTTNTQEATTTKQIDLKNTPENEPTTESSKVESTTESEKQESPIDKIQEVSKEPNNDEKKEKVAVDKIVESETEQNEKYETTETDNEATTEKYETKDQNEEEIISSTIIDKPEISKEPSI